MSELNGYGLHRAWFDFSFENPDRCRPVHSAVYCYMVEACNRFGWKEKFTLPSYHAMEVVGIKSHKTYMRAFNDLEEWGFIKVIQRSKNADTSNVIALVKNTKASTKAHDKAMLMHVPKQVQPGGTIDKPDKSENQKPRKQQSGEFCFQKFWSIYAKKVKRKESQRKWNKLATAEKEFILKHLPGYVSQTRPDVRFRPDPLTFLNGRRWEDEEFSKIGNQETADLGLKKGRVYE